MSEEHRLSAASKIKIGIAFGLIALAAGMTYVALSGNRFVCEVCIELGGKMECRKASGQTGVEARQAAADTACWVLARTVTEGQTCRGASPYFAGCSETK